MKDYSEEIDLIVLELFGSAFAQGDMGMVTSKKATDKASTQIKSLFREIVNECMGAMEDPKIRTEYQGEGFSLDRFSHKIDARNELRCEIKSNIEKVIK